MPHVQQLDQNKLVLLVEDSEDDILLSLRAFKHQQDVQYFDVAVCRDGQEALEFLFQRFDDQDSLLPSLILLDINLPKLSGLEVLKRLRGDPRAQGVPIVMLTTSVQNSDIFTSYANGANSFLLKPVSSNEFENVIKKVCNYWLWLNRPSAPKRERQTADVSTCM